MNSGENYPFFRYTRKSGNCTDLRFNSFKNVKI